MRSTWKYIIISILLILAQGVLDNYVNLSIYLNVTLFVFPLLMLPVRTGTVPAMLAAFIIGLVVDILGNGIPGLTAAALTAAALLRKTILGLIVPKDPSSKDGKGSMEDLGIRQFAVYSAVMCLIFLLAYILLDCAGFRPFWQCILRLCASLAVNTTLMTLLFAVSSDNRKR